MKSAPIPLTAERSIALVNNAIREGRHSTTVRTVCGVCREWCDGHFHIGFDGTGMCKACADKIGQGPASIDAARMRGGK
jgi:hypothetical protein